MAEQLHTRSTHKQPVDEGEEESGKNGLKLSLQGTSLLVQWLRL